MTFGFKTQYMYIQPIINHFITWHLFSGIPYLFISVNLLHRLPTTLNKTHWLSLAIVSWPNWKPTSSSSRILHKQSAVLPTSISISTWTDLWTRIWRRTDDCWTDRRRVEHCPLMLTINLLTYLLTLFWCNAHYNDLIYVRDVTLWFIFLSHKLQSPCVMIMFNYLLLPFFTLQLVYWTKIVLTVLSETSAMTLYIGSLPWIIPWTSVWPWRMAAVAKLLAMFGKMLSW